MTTAYNSPESLPGILPLFPLNGAIMLPRAPLTLNVFEPRYLKLVDYALAHNRLFGVVQPSPGESHGESPKGKNFGLRNVGCAGRIVAFNETDEGPLVITLSGIARFTTGTDVQSDEPFRLCTVDFSAYRDDFVGDLGEDEVDRVVLLDTLRRYLEANGLGADWERINAAPNEQIINTLAVLSPYGPEEKQALLEASSLKARADALVALAEMELAARDDSSGTSLQ